MVADQINGNDFLRHFLIISEILEHLSVPRLVKDDSESVTQEEKDG